MAENTALHFQLWLSDSVFIEMKLIFQNLETKAINLSFWKLIGYRFFFDSFGHENQLTDMNAKLWICMYVNLCRLIGCIILTIDNILSWWIKHGDICISVTFQFQPRNSKCVCSCVEKIMTKLRRTVLSSIVYVKGLAKYQFSN